MAEWSLSPPQKIEAQSSPVSEIRSAPAVCFSSKPAFNPYRPGAKATPLSSGANGGRNAKSLLSSALKRLGSICACAKMLRLILAYH
jgi:hypothetical protein